MSSRFVTCSSTAPGERACSRGVPVTATEHSRVSDAYRSHTGASSAFFTITHCSVPLPSRMTMNATLPDERRCVTHPRTVTVSPTWWRSADTSTKAVFMRGGKLGMLVRIRNLALVSLAVVGCAVTFRDVPRDGVNESRQFMLTPSRAPFADVSIGSAPVVAWRAKGIHGSVSLPVVGERITLVTTTDKFLYAIDTRSGAVLWRHRAP